MKRLALVWHIHQPFFVPRDELLDQIRGSYEGLVELHRELAVPWSLNVSGALLERIEVMAPELLDALRAQVITGQLELLGSGKCHPLLPLLSPARAKAQVLADKEVKEGLFQRAPTGFWPTDLAVGHGQTALLADAGYEVVVADGTAKLAQAMRPSFTLAETHGAPVLAPILDPLVAESEFASVDRATLADRSIDFVYRHPALTQRLVDQSEGALHRAEAVEPFIAAVSEYLNHAAPRLLLGDDGERVTSGTLLNYRSVLEGLRGTGLEFATLSTYRASATPRAAYVPTSTATGSFDAWRLTADDEACLLRLQQVSARLCAMQRGTGPRMRDTLATLSEALLPLEDAAFTFWKHARRTREPFLAGLLAIDEALDALEGEPAGA